MPRFGLIRATMSAILGGFQGACASVKPLKVGYVRYIDFAVRLAQFVFNNVTRKTDRRERLMRRYARLILCTTSVLTCVYCAPASAQGVPTTGDSQSAAPVVGTPWALAGAQ